MTEADKIQDPLVGALFEKHPWFWTGQDANQVRCRFRDLEQDLTTELGRTKELESQLHTANAAAKVYKEVAEETQAALRGFAELKAYIEAQRDRATPQWTGLVLETILVHWPSTPPEPPQPVSEAPKPESSTRSAESPRERSEERSRFDESIGLRYPPEYWANCEHFIAVDSAPLRSDTCLALGWLTEEVLRLRGNFQVQDGTIIVRYDSQPGKVRP